ncbi:hypothetical protein QE152_g29324 [Popillia japonica]|uniref:Uncharacterized protein n=1 Tax=Popillia japonica TaxID=7064 RepID=A0AAW1JI70_POPJA
MKEQLAFGKPAGESNGVDRRRMRRNDFFFRQRRRVLFVEDADPSFGRYNLCFGEQRIIYRAEWTAPFHPRTVAPSKRKSEERTTASRLATSKFWIVSREHSYVHATK